MHHSRRITLNQASSLIDIASKWGRSEEEEGNGSDEIIRQFTRVGFSIGVKKTRLTSEWALFVERRQDVVSLASLMKGVKRQATSEFSIPGLGQVKVFIGHDISMEEIAAAIKQIDWLATMEGFLRNGVRHNNDGLGETRKSLTFDLFGISRPAPGERKKYASLATLNPEIFEEVVVC